MKKVAFFFFEAEDGIRGLVRVRWLGDGYKEKQIRKLMKQFTDMGGKPGRKGRPGRGMRFPF